MPMLDNRNEGFWISKQASGKGTPATTAEKQWRKVGGDLNVNRSDGSENYSEGSRFGDAMDWVDTVIGEGSPVGQSQPGTVGHAAALLLGADSVSTISAAAGLYDHVITPGTSGFYSTAWKKVGAAVGPLRQKFNDCRPVSLRIEGSSANKVVKQTLELLSLDPGEIFTADPIKTLDSDKPFIYTEGAGRFIIDGTTYTGHSSFALVLGDGVTPWYGDAATPFDVGFGIAQVTLEGITLAVDSAGLQRYYQQIYGTTSPAAGVKPVKVVPSDGSYVAEFRKGQSQTITITGTPAGGSFTITVPAVSGITGGGTTVAIAYNATAATVQSALETVIGVGRVTVTGGPLPGTAVQIVFRDYMGVPGAPTNLTTTDSLTGGTSPASAVTNNGHNRGLKVQIPSVHWTPDIAISGNPEGGNTEIALGASARVPSSGAPIVTITARTGDSAAYTA